MALHTVLILSVGATCRARPAYQSVKPGDEVKFSNYGGATATLNFPAGLFDRDQLTLSVVAAANKDTVTVQDVPDGRYVYSGSVGGVPLEGESSPEIIVDR